jgi:hypothetical protein
MVEKSDLHDKQRRRNLKNRRGRISKTIFEESKRLKKTSEKLIENEKKICRTRWQNHIMKLE